MYDLTGCTGWCMDRHGWGQKRYGTEYFDSLDRIRLLHCSRKPYNTNRAFCFHYRLLELMNRLVQPSREMASVSL